MLSYFWLQSINTRVHGRRHTFANLLLSNGESPAYAKDRVGAEGETRTRTGVRPLDPERFSVAFIIQLLFIPFHSLTHCKQGLARI